MAPSAAVNHTTAKHLLISACRVSSAVRRPSGRSICRRSAGRSLPPCWTVVSRVPGRPAGRRHRIHFTATAERLLRLVVGRHTLARRVPRRHCAQLYRYNISDRDSGRRDVWPATQLSLKNVRYKTFHSLLVQFVVEQIYNKSNQWNLIITVYCDEIRPRLTDSLVGCLLVLI